MAGLVWKKDLTDTEKARLDLHGNRAWTEEESRIMKANIAFVDHARKVLKRRCANCDFTLVSNNDRETHEIPGTTGGVCEMCFDLYHALLFPFNGFYGLKDKYYFTKLHHAWEKDKNDDGGRGGRRDKLGL